MIPIKDCFQNDHKPTKDSLSQYFFVQCSCPANILLRTIFTSVLDPFRESPSIMLGCGGKKDTDMCGVAGFFVGCVRLQGIWNQERRNLREYLAHLVDPIMRRVCGDASAAVRVFFV